MGQQFQDADFPALSGARVVRIAVHPELGRAGYGSRALELLRRYYEVSRGSGENYSHDKMNMQRYESCTSRCTPSWGASSVTGAHWRCAAVPCWLKH